MPSDAVARFRALHESGCFVMPNPWDVGSAVLLEQLGFAALATTSAGFSFTRGRPDALTSVTRDDVLSHVRDIVDATSLPVNADFQTGYADAPADVVANVALCVATGAAGLSIEDASGDPSAPLYPKDLAVRRIRAAREAIDGAESGTVLTARCEAYLVGEAHAHAVVLDRLLAYAEAGADCVFAPGVRDLASISAIVQAVAPVPVNVLVSAPGPEWSLDRLADVGVRRVSVGSALARVAWGAVLRAARDLQNGSFDGLGGAASFAELNAAFRPALP